MQSRLSLKIVIITLLGFFVSCEKSSDDAYLRELKRKIDNANRLHKVYNKMIVKEGDLNSLVDKWYIGMKSTYYDGKINPLSEYKERPEYSKILENKLSTKIIIIKLIKKEDEPLFCLYQLLYDIFDWNIDELDDIIDPKQFILKKIEISP